MQYLTKLPATSLLNIHGADSALGELIAIYKIDYNSHRGMIAISTGGHQTKVQFVWLAMSRSRIMWPDYDPKETDPKPLCKSLDANLPIGGITMRPGPCNACQDAKWIEGNPPLCAEIFNLLCWDVQQQLPFIFGVKRTGIKPLRLLKVQLKLQALQHGYHNIPDHCCAKLELKAKPEGTYFVPQFTILSRLTEAEALCYYELAQRFLAQIEPVDPEDLNGNNGHH